MRRRTIIAATVLPGLAAFLLIRAVDRPEDGNAPRPAPSAETAGYRVTAVQNGGPARRAGVRVGDLVFAIGQQQLEDSEVLAESLEEITTGQDVMLGWSRREYWEYQYSAERHRHDKAEILKVVLAPAIFAGIASLCYNALCWSTAIVGRRVAGRFQIGENRRE